MRVKSAVYDFRSELFFRLFGMGILILGMLLIAATTALGQTVYYYGPQPIVVQPYPAVVGQQGGPIIVQVIDPPAPPPAMVQVVSPPAPPTMVTSPVAVAPASVPVPAAASVAVSGGISNVCVSCSNVTQTINVAKKAKAAGRSAVATKQSPAPGNVSPPATSAAGRDDWWLFPLLMALLGGLFLAMLGWVFGRSRQPRPGPPAPPPLPVASSASPVAASAAPVAVSAPAGPPAADPGMVTIPMVIRVEAEPIIIGMNPVVRRPHAPSPTQAPAAAAPRVRVGRVGAA